MTTVLEPELISVPGVYDIPADRYHADPVAGGSLSSSGARLLLRCPAAFNYAQKHPAIPTPVFDFGHAAHRLVLSAGADIVEVEANDWRTNVAKAARAAAHTAGKIPLLSKDMAEVNAMATALREHPIAAALLNPATGYPEQTIVWRDDETGVWRRAMLDWLPDPAIGRRMVVPDYKTTASAALADLARTVASYGYHQQAAWYCDAVTAVGHAGGLDPAFVFIAQEKEPPYLVTVFQLDDTAIRIGRQLNRRALDLYADCTLTGRWPGYSAADDIPTLALPKWVERQHEETL